MYVQPPPVFQYPLHLSEPQIPDMSYSQDYAHLQRNRSLRGRYNTSRSRGKHSFNPERPMRGDHRTYKHSKVGLGDQSKTGPTGQVQGANNWHEDLTPQEIVDDGKSQLSKQSDDKADKENKISPVKKEKADRYSDFPGREQGGTGQKSSIGRTFTRSAAFKGKDGRSRSGRNFNHSNSHTFQDPDSFYSKNELKHEQLHSQSQRWNQQSLQSNKAPHQRLIDKPENSGSSKSMRDRKSADIRYCKNENAQLQERRQYGSSRSGSSRQDQIQEEQKYSVNERRLGHLYKENSNSEHIKVPGGDFREDTTNQKEQNITKVQLDQDNDKWGRGGEEEVVHMNIGEMRIRKLQGQRGRTGMNFSSRQKFNKDDENQRSVLIEQLSCGTYECMVCCETVRVRNAVWSCTNCYHCFHLRCIKAWARSSTTVLEGSDNSWRCPACQNVTFKFPNEYRCFCGKVRDPDVNMMDTPHCCGDICNKSRGRDCPHKCTILCHPGPCPPCSIMVSKSCDCGKTFQKVRCGQSIVLKCGSMCQKTQNCGKHQCKATCHSGPCDKCEEIIKQVCFCAHSSREVLCGSAESFLSSYSCGDICDRPLGCGNHRCEAVCHDGECNQCPLLPALVTHCPCGKSLLEELNTMPRTSCLDPIPTCTNMCSKTLACGPEGSKHTCNYPCHVGPCGDCQGQTTLKCRCGAVEKVFDCFEVSKFTANNPFLCDKRCNKKKNCGSHKCGQVCCVNVEHVCDQICGRKLKCGLHKCDERCHRGNCPPCLIASFEELTCYCGSEVLMPPIPCGAKPPECHKQCTREHPCRHPVRHNCHSEEHCPPCTELVEKMCMGGHELRKNIPCYREDVSCGLPCGRILPCGQHKCLKLCHKDECFAPGEKCVQPCQQKRAVCGHPCQAPCHNNEPCPRTSCKAEITIKCPCEHREAKVLCSLEGGEADISDYQRITMQSIANSLQGKLGCQSIDLNQFSGCKKGTTRQLECNEECALVERNRRVASALDIPNPDLSAKLGNPPYSDFLKDYARQNQHYVASVEKALSELIQSAKQSKHPNRSHSFPSGNRDQRRLIHELAELYGCETKSYDFEPNRNVVVTAHRERCWLPSITLTAYIQREIHGRAPVPIPHVHKEDVLRQTAQAAKLSTKVLGEGEGWKMVGKKSRKPSERAHSASSAIDYFDFSNKSSPTKASSTKPDAEISYSNPSQDSRNALKSEKVVDYFDFTSN
ncbi:hypothetical protein CHS0354_017856 [Potamilus streckersoni]|uniref:Transcriptional repressor NF-X1 n=1 Tax=Potamilus streckersoni TaxID=2493646 RepID=A0AAE0T6P4_9BIVA|nr:hypothetical protein CHS0354_017856 [Potamilus streckersoni]